MKEPLDELEAREDDSRPIPLRKTPRARAEGSPLATEEDAKGKGRRVTFGDRVKALRQEIDSARDAAAAVVAATESRPRDF